MDANSFSPLCGDDPILFELILLLDHFSPLCGDDPFQAVIKLAGKFFSPLCGDDPTASQLQQGTDLLLPAMRG